MLGAVVGSPPLILTLEKQHLYGRVPILPEVLSQTVAIW
jgi:hypothetical protein